MASAPKKKAEKRAPEGNDQVTTTATHEIRTDQFGNLLSCTNLESGEDEALPADLRYLAN